MLSPPFRPFASVALAGLGATLVGALAFLAFRPRSGRAVVLSTTGPMEVAERRRAADPETEAKVEKFMAAPVTRREFEQELDRLWRFIDPTYDQPDAARINVRTEARLARPFGDQVKTAFNALTRGRPAPPGVRQDAQEYAERIILLRDRRDQLNAMPGVSQAAVRLKKGNAPLRTPPDVLGYARELIAVQRDLADLRAPIWGEDARRRWR